MDVRTEAASARAAGMVRHGDRPQQRRNAPHERAPRGVLTRGRPTLRGAADPEPNGLVSFTGLACATESRYPMWDFFGPYTEVVSDGAFAKTLTTPDLDVPLVLQHVDIRRLARTTIPAGEPGSLTLSEDAGVGLVCDALLDPADPDVAYILPKMRAGLVDEMSFRFHITGGEWSPDWTEYRIAEVDIHRGDVAICGYGANPATTAAVRTSDITKVITTTNDLVLLQGIRDAVNARIGIHMPQLPRSRRFVVTDSDLT